MLFLTHVGAQHLQPHTASTRCNTSCMPPQDATMQPHSQLLPPQPCPDALAALPAEHAAVKLCCLSTRVAFFEAGTP